MSLPARDCRVSRTAGIAHLGRASACRPSYAVRSRIDGDLAVLARFRDAGATVAPVRAAKTIQFFREVSWARRCERLYGDAPGRCPRALCMEAIELPAVIAAIESLGITTRASR
jgi:hypothetical protein